MAAGNTTYSTISANVNTIIERSWAVARMTNVLLPTITNLNSAGMNPRRVEEYNAATWVQAGEDDDVSAQTFTKDTITTLTPARYAMRFDVTDQRAASDYDMVMADAAMEMGSSAGRYVDVQIASNFSSLTGGTMGNAGTAITWAHITKAYSVLVDQGVPAAAPVYCALHPYQCGQ